jgi:hypothetical protein
VKAAGIELSMYVVLGIGGCERTESHALETARVLNQLNPDFIRLRTFVPKTNTPLLKEVEEGTFQMLGPHGVIKETAMLLRYLNTQGYLASDHYTNYVNLEGNLPKDKGRLLEILTLALKQDESCFRPFFIGDQ